MRPHDGGGTVRRGRFTVSPQAPAEADADETEQQPSAESGNSFRRGRFTVSQAQPSQRQSPPGSMLQDEAEPGSTLRRGRVASNLAIHVETDADEAEHGSTTTSAHSVPTVEHIPAERTHREQQALQKLHAVLEAQQQAWTKTWQDMEEQVYHLLLHDSNSRSTHQRSTQAHTPTSAQSFSPCRTPPFDNGSERQRTGPKSGSSTASTSTAMPSSAAVQSDNPRENTLRMWSSLGSTLREVVDRNEQLEDENRRLGNHLDDLQRQIAAAKRSLAQAVPLGSPTGVQLARGTPCMVSPLVCRHGFQRAF